MNNAPFHETEFNVGNSIFPGFNDKRGLMICGYEYGYSKRDEQLERAILENTISAPTEITTFYNKSKFYNSPYDLRIVRWFEIFDHPLGRGDGFSPFDKCILQTNWCADQGRAVENYNKFLDDGKNFLQHMEHYRPSLIIFLGSKLIGYLQQSKIKGSFSKIVGEEVEPLKLSTKDFVGRRFKIGFQKFKDVDIVSFPHPSGTRGLSDNYIKLFAEEMGSRLADFKRIRGI